MKKIQLLTLCVSTAFPALLIVTAASAQVTWTATSSPTPATIAGGPWTLPQGQGTSTYKGPFDGLTPYCSAGAPIVNASSVVNTFAPYYFPFITGRGNNLQGYFDYRPKNINEAVVAANSTDGGQTWHFQQQVENLTTDCPATDVNKNGTDDGLGHSYVINFGGASWIYLLDRQLGHADSDGLIVNTLRPQAGNPTNPLPANSPFVPPSANVITGWNFDSDVNTGGFNTSPAPSTGTGAATPLGMVNNYTFSTSPVTIGSTDGEDVTATAGSSDPASGFNNNAWRIRGPNNVAGPPGTGNGWNTAAPQYTQGAQFTASTSGYNYVVFQYDWYTTAQGVRDLQAQYTADGATWTNVGPLQVAPPGGGFVNQITLDFHKLGITSVNNNPNFGVRLVSVYDPGYTGAGAPTYTGATLSATGTPTVYNNNSGNWRFDEVNILGTTNGTNPLTSTVTNTTGLTNPDGILAVVPGTYPIKVLYISKTLSADYSLPQCVPPGTVGINHDVETARIATTPDGVHFTDTGGVNGLSDPTTISYSGIRYVSPNGTLLKLGTGKWGLFFGGGNCLDGDSDAFHAIMYAESSDLVNWTVINGINNPIASITTVTGVTDPVTQQTVTIPATAPVVGTTALWFGGRVYAPQAMWSSSNSVNLIFAGYDSGYSESGTSKDLSSYRTIGQVQLSSGATTLP